MTLKEVVGQVHGMAVDGTFNGQNFTKKELEFYLSNLFRVSNKVFMTVVLPDGEWVFRVNKLSDGYDYVLPDNREQEKRLVRELLGNGVPMA